MGASGRIKCLDCDALFDPSPSGRGPRRQRCDLHRALRKAQLQRAQTALLRAKEWGVVAELVIADEVFARDDWLCHICNKPVPERLRSGGFRAGVYEPLAPAVDHVIPMSKGGPHTMDNCATAHWTCNSQKAAADGYSEAEAEIFGHVQPEPPTPPTNPCNVEGCIREKYVKGMCNPHYMRNHKYGHPLKMKCGCGCGEIVLVGPEWLGLFYIDGHGVQCNVTVPAEQLRQKLTAQPVSDRGIRQHNLLDDCLIWTGPQTKKGYGVINFRARKGVMNNELAHRVAYELANGEESAREMTIDHLCGVPLCCNPNHLEAVSLAENIRRSALAITACPQGHVYDEQNTLYTPDGHRVCRQCNRNNYHRDTFGHDFVLDPDNPSTKRQRCLTCRLRKESTPQFCPHGHEYTPANTRLDNKGNKYCIQCGLNRRHVEQFGHEFVIDESNPSEKRHRCLTCTEAAPPVTHCAYGHEYTDLTLELSPKGHRKCVQCRLNKTHVTERGHEYAIDPEYKAGSRRRCMVCEDEKKSKLPTHCVNGHEFTVLTTEYHSTRGHRVCVQCRLDKTHIPKYGHQFAIDPNHTGKLRSCLICNS
jgi:hypothetical protein